MIMAEAVARRGEWTKADDTITLDETARHRRRMAMVTDGGIAFLLNLPEAVRLRDGDALVFDDGRFVEVKAKPEPLYEVKGHDTAHLLRLAWHLGNRHQAAAIEGRRLFIRRDPVLKTMLEGLGARVLEVDAAFDPEGGAYDGEAEHSH
ncbi:urease accessory protein UreE [Consotaella salsifontis]|uniref:Urease accessory protein UreE n=1 Tax=Consotaella salsifontis TaxID=1365950 RepID=A0A1T4SRH8_9HYPH|nr:urease accessory protein UreE [Consotaella salsifontis]SKA30766.1 urease accessory protein [Consotaella salsifontis]